jgi:hypothetical protein
MVSKGRVTFKQKWNSDAEILFSSFTSKRAQNRDEAKVRKQDHHDKLELP